jgi:hypothetical protein
MMNTAAFHALMVAQQGGLPAVIHGGVVHPHLVVVVIIPNPNPETLLHHPNNQISTKVSDGLTSFASQDKKRVVLSALV